MPATPHEGPVPQEVQPTAENRESSPELSLEQAGQKAAAELTDLEEQAAYEAGLSHADALRANAQLVRENLGDKVELIAERKNKIGKKFKETISFLREQLNNILQSKQVEPAPKNSPDDFKVSNPNRKDQSSGIFSLSESEQAAIAAAQAQVAEARFNQPVRNPNRSEQSPTSFSLTPAEQGMVDNALLDKKVVADPARREKSPTHVTLNASEQAAVNAAKEQFNAADLQQKIAQENAEIDAAFAKKTKEENERRALDNPAFDVSMARTNLKKLAKEIASAQQENDPARLRALLAEQTRQVDLLINASQRQEKQTQDQEMWNNLAPQDRSIKKLSPAELESAFVGHMFKQPTVERIYFVGNTQKELSQALNRPDLANLGMTAFREAAADAIGRLSAGEKRSDLEAKFRLMQKVNNPTEALTQIPTDLMNTEESDRILDAAMEQITKPTKASSREKASTPTTAEILSAEKTDGIETPHDKLDLSDEIKKEVTEQRDKTIISDLQTQEAKNDRLAEIAQQLKALDFGITLQGGNKDEIRAALLSEKKSIEANLSSSSQNETSHEEGETLLDITEDAAGGLNEMQLKQLKDALAATGGENGTENLTQLFAADSTLRTTIAESLTNADAFGAKIAAQAREKGVDLWTAIYSAESRKDARA